MIENCPSTATYDNFSNGPFHKTTITPVHQLANSCQNVNAPDRKKWSFTGLFRRKKKKETSRRKQSDEFDYIVPLKTNQTSQVKNSKPINTTCNNRSENKLTLKYDYESNNQHLLRNSICTGSLDSYTKKQCRKRAELRRIANLMTSGDSSEDENGGNSTASSIVLVKSDNDSVVSSSHSKRTRSARTERYIRRLSRDEEKMLNQDALLKKGFQNNLYNSETIFDSNLSNFHNGVYNSTNKIVTRSPRMDSFLAEKSCSYSDVNHLNRYKSMFSKNEPLTQSTITSPANQRKSNIFSSELNQSYPHTTTSGELFQKDNLPSNLMQTCTDTNSSVRSSSHNSPGTLSPPPPPPRNPKRKDLNYYRQLCDRPASYSFENKIELKTKPNNRESYKNSVESQLENRTGSCILGGYVENKADFNQGNYINRYSSDSHLYKDNSTLRLGDPLVENVTSLSTSYHRNPNMKLIDAYKNSNCPSNIPQFTNNPIQNNTVVTNITNTNKLLNNSSYETGCFDVNPKMSNNLLNNKSYDYLTNKEPQGLTTREAINSSFETEKYHFNNGHNLKTVTNDSRDYKTKLPHNVESCKAKLPWYARHSGSATDISINELPHSENTQNKFNSTNKLPNSFENIPTNEMMWGPTKLPCSSYRFACRGNSPINPDLQDFNSPFYGGLYGSNDFQNDGNLNYDESRYNDNEQLEYLNTNFQQTQNHEYPTDLNVQYDLMEKTRELPTDAYSNYGVINENNRPEFNQFYGNYDSQDVDYTLQDANYGFGNVYRSPGDINHDIQGINYNHHSVDYNPQYLNYQTQDIHYRPLSLDYKGQTNDNRPQGVSYNFENENDGFLSMQNYGLPVLGDNYFQTSNGDFKSQNNHLIHTSNDFSNNNGSVKGNFRDLSQNYEHLDGNCAIIEKMSQNGDLPNNDNIIFKNSDQNMGNVQNAYQNEFYHRNPNLTNEYLKIPNIHKTSSKSPSSCLSSFSEFDRSSLSPMNYSSSSQSTQNKFDSQRDMLHRRGEIGTLAKENSSPQREALNAHSIVSSKSPSNFEEALNELDEIYNSLQLGDESLLDRAESRDMSIFNHMMEEKLRDTPVMPPDSFEDEPDVVTDDVVYRKMNQAKSPTPSHDNVPQVSYLLLSNAEYPEMTSPPNGLEPDVTLDDMVYRSVKQHQNSLKIREPQPMFGIPKGPVAPTPHSDYLRVKPETKDEWRTKLIEFNRKQRVPDVINDDLAVRRLRRDFGSQALLNTERVKGTPKKKAIRSLSANIFELNSFGNTRSYPNIHDKTFSDPEFNDDYPNSDLRWTNNQLYDGLDALLDSLKQQSRNRSSNLGHMSQNNSIDSSNDRDSFSFNRTKETQSKLKKKELRDSFYADMIEASESRNHLENKENLGDYFKPENNNEYGVLSEDEVRRVDLNGKQGDVMIVNLEDDSSSLNNETDLDGTDLII